MLTTEIIKKIFKHKLNVDFVQKEDSNIFFADITPFQYCFEMDPVHECVHVSITIHFRNNTELSFTLDNARTVQELVVLIKQFKSIKDLLIEPPSYKCGWCDKEIDQEFFIANGEIICEDCNEHAKTCERCGEVFHEDETNSDMCDICLDDMLE